MYVRIFYVCLSYHGWYSHAVWAVLSWYLMYVKIFVPWKVITCSTRENFLVLNVRKKFFISDVRIVSSMIRSFKKKTRIQKSKSFPVKPLPAVYTDFCQEKKLSRLIYVLVLYSYWSSRGEKETAKHKKNKQQSTTAASNMMFCRLFFSHSPLADTHDWL